MEVSDAEKAKSFWAQVDVDQAFESLLGFLLCLRDSIKNSTATDNGYILGMNIILQAEVSLTPALPNDPIEAMLISEDILTVSVSDSHCTMLKMKDGSVLDVLHEDGSRSSKNLESDSNQTLGRFDSDDLFAPVSPVQLSYKQHDCGPACLPQLPLHSDSLLAQNPLRVPLLCHFQRHCAKPLKFPDEDSEVPVKEPEMDVLYKSPCGRSLRCMDEVLQFLRQTESLGVLQPTHFSFDPLVLQERQTQLRPPGSAQSLPASGVFERDVSRGTEAVPIPLCNEVDGVRPREFRYRKDRWPHGCFLSKAPLFVTCCDCTDGCTESSSCSCLRLSVKAGAKPEQLYSHQRLNEPSSTGLYECNPWCGCEKRRCQNRVVQRGLRVRLQVFRTHDRGWGVRCRDDLDKGTFVCTYSGVVLRLGRSLEEPLPPKSQKEEPWTDDEVEVVEEWTLPAGQKKTSSETQDTSPSLHVPVIQRPADQLSATLEGERGQLESTDKQEEPNPSSPKSNKTEIEDRGDEKMVRKKPRLDDRENGNARSADQTVPRRDGKRGAQEKMYYLDASKDGNVARFINHSCNPNLFIQNVFVDTHDRKFPMIAFFTSRSVKAGTELTWNCSYEPGSDPEHEVPCLCGNENCQAVLI
ncbi:histone-lysine N-methyltransferase SETDB2 isoform X2 [Trichomycterus rosablanca]|uniref:histone-lysine N-methyltransferase SETDB2 isoform X2 n=1 Tax=Trichomycterus rosablanca TaxID=2290929 RepID=UPI002F35069C